MTVGQSSQDVAAIFNRVVKTRGLKTTRIAPPPQGPDKHVGSIQISQQNAGAIKAHDDTNQMNNVSDIMTEYGEFYMEIQFDHI